ncbi:MAG: type II toxin-antitoxin system Phd/YefM family antitoxin [Chloroflexia bacterium]|nr:type II toxin-antitoxin system Phd/YefM family antitoxin [Chloroflexia bacterium]
MSATEARRQLGELMRLIVESNEFVIVQRRGIPKVAIISIEQYNEIERRQETQRSIRQESAENTRK